MQKADSSPSLDSIIEALKGEREYPASWLDLSPIKRFKAETNPPQYGITEKTIDRFEEDTIKAASEAIRVLEDALAKWESMKGRPDAEDYKEQFDDFQKLHAELTRWEQGILKSRARGEALGFDSRVKRLLEYSRIFEAHR